MRAVPIYSQVLCASEGPPKEILGWILVRRLLQRAQKNLLRYIIRFDEFDATLHERADDIGSANLVGLRQFSQNRIELS